MTTASYDGGEPVPAYWSPISSRQIDSGNGYFKNVLGTTLRIFKSYLPAVAQGKQFQLFDKNGDLVATVVPINIPRCAYDPEWVLDCEAVSS